MRTVVLDRVVLTGRTVLTVLGLLAAGLLPGCELDLDPRLIVNPDSYDWRLPAHFRVPRVPADNAMSADKVRLGRFLFYDVNLSEDQSQSCASCHHQAQAFSQNSTVTTGITGQTTPRSSMSLGNVAWYPVLTWANPVLDRLEKQALVPLFGENPIELGLSGREELLLQRLNSEETYRELFYRAFPLDDEALSVNNMVKALASFQRSLITADSAYDRFIGGDAGALSPQAKEGMKLFFGEKFECFHCHGGFNFTDSTDFEGKLSIERNFHNNGLYNLDAAGAYPEPNTGLYGFTGKDRDMGAFRAPSLRNIEYTAPYMHDGSIASLEEVVEHYAAGGRNITSGELAGDGRLNPAKSVLVRPFNLEPGEKEALVEFLKSLSDQQFINNPEYANPWPQGSLQNP